MLIGMVSENHMPRAAVAQGGGGHPFSTYAVKGGGGGGGVKFCLFSYVRPYKNSVQGGGGGQKWLKCCVRTIWMPPSGYYPQELQLIA